MSLFTQYLESEDSLTEEEACEYFKSLIKKNKDFKVVHETKELDSIQTRKGPRKNKFSLKLKTKFIYVKEFYVYIQRQTISVLTKTDDNTSALRNINLTKDCIDQLVKALDECPEKRLPVTHIMVKEDGNKIFYASIYK